MAKSKRKGCIYLITNICNKKHYVGQTIQKNPARRWVEHLDTMNKCTNQLPLYRALRKFAIENFTFSVLESDISLETLNEREVYYVNKYKSNIRDFGYNCTQGGSARTDGQGQLVNETQVMDIIHDIKNKTNYTFKEIGAMYGIADHNVSDINCGDTWYFPHETYPIRDNSHRFNKLKANIDKVHKRLQEGLPFIQIAKEFKVSATNISNVNSGLIYKKEGIVYPIYTPPNSTTRLTLENLKDLVRLLENNEGSYSYLSRKFEGRCGRKTLSNIDKGVWYSKELEELGITEFPIRGTKL